MIDGLHLKAPAQFNTRTQAGPEPAKKGKKINVAGQLVVVSYKQNGWTGFVGQPLKVQFKARGGKYKTVKTGEYGDRRIHLHLGHRRERLRQHRPRRSPERAPTGRRPTGGGPSAGIEAVVGPVPGGEPAHVLGGSASVSRTR